MFTLHDAYVAEKTQDQSIEHMQHIANDPSLIERVAQAIWIVIRTTLRGLAYGFLAVGNGLLHLTRQAQAQPIETVQALGTLSHD